MTKSKRQSDRILRSSGVFLCLAIFSLGGTVAHGQEALPAPPAPRLLSLQDCISMALQESPALEAGRYDVAAATEEVRAEKAKLLPELTGSVSALAFSGSPTSKFSVVNVGESGGVVVNPNSSKNVDLAGVGLYSAHLSYPLFKEGSILGLNDPPAVKSKEARKRNLTWTSQLRREQVVDRITDAYITTVSAINRAGYAERRVNLLNSMVGILQEQQKQGLTLPIDLQLARGQLSGARALSKILREQAVAGTIELSRSLGMDSASELHLQTSLPNPPDPPNAEKLLGDRLNQHPSLQIQRAVIDQAKEDYRLERYRLYPSVTLDGTALHIDDFSSSNGAEVYTAAVTVTIPILDFGAQLATTRSKLAKYKAERARLLSVADDVTFEVVKTYQEIYILSQNILSLQEKVAKAERDLQVSSSQQQQGISPPLTSIDKELRLIANKDDLDGLEVRRLVLYSALQKAAGGSWQWTK